jgi:hypothetical protein
MLAVIGGSASLVGGGTNFAARASAQGQQIVCLHGANETPAQTTRRIAAIQVARNVNTSESYASSVYPGAPYQPLERMQAQLMAPEGFSLALSTDGKSYMFSLKDKTDACGFTIFSDQDGLIYKGGPLQ